MARSFKLTVSSSWHEHLDFVEADVRRGDGGGGLMADIIRSGFANARSGL